RPFRLLAAGNKYHPEVSSESSEQSECVLSGERRSGVVARDFMLFLPLLLVVAGSLKKDSHHPEPGVFSEQAWRYVDVLLIVVLLTATGFLDVPSRLKDQLGAVGVSAVALTTQAVLILGAIYSILRWKYGLPFAALGLGRRDSLHHLLWSLKIFF